MGVNKELMHMYVELLSQQVQELADYVEADDADKVFIWLAQIEGNCVYAANNVVDFVSSDALQQAKKLVSP